MKVLVISHLYPSPGRERSLFVEDQVRALAALGVEVSVLSPTGFAPRITWVSERLRQRGHVPRRAVRSGILVEYPRVPVLPHMLLFSHSGDLYYFGLRRYLPELRRAGIDLIHAHQALPDGAAAQRLARELGVPYLVTVHGRDVYHHLRQPGRIAAVARHTLASADAVMAVSHAVARQLADVVPRERLHVVPNGVSARPSTATAHQRWGEYARPHQIILSVGYLIERKGHATVLAALARARSQVRPWYVIVGEGPERARLQARAADLGVADQVRFLGRLPHDDVLGLMARADLFVLPSWDEAFGLVYAEAMAQGTPVVGCQGEGLEDFVTDGETGYLVPARDPDALAGVIVRVLSDSATAARVGEAGRAAVAGLTWARNAERQKAIYEQVLAARAAPGWLADRRSAGQPAADARDEPDQPRGAGTPAAGRPDGDGGEMPRRSSHAL